MNNTDSVTSSKQRPLRRVGTVTMGVVLVITGAIMLVSMFYPKFDFTWVIKLSPLVLISLGVETLVSTRNGSRIKYDWVGMILCFLIVCTALCMFFLSWYLLYHPEFIHF